MTKERKIGRRGKTLYYSLDTRLETRISSLVIIFLILITFSLENVVTLLGENRCCSLLGFKGFRQITTVVGISSHFNNYAWNKAAETPTPGRNKRRFKTASSCPYDP